MLLAPVSGGLLCTFGPVVVVVVVAVVLVEALLDEEMPCLLLFNL